MSFFVACITSESRTELTLNSSSRISKTCETYTDGNALRSGEMSYRNNLKSQTTTNWRTQPFLTPPIFGTLTYPSYAVPIPRVGSIPNGRLAETMRHGTAFIKLTRDFRLRIYNKLLRLITLIVRHGTHRRYFVTTRHMAREATHFAHDSLPR